MSQAKQATQDSFSVFLRNVRKKDDKTREGPSSRKVSFSVLKELHEHGPMDVHAIADRLEITTVRTMQLLGNLQDAQLIEIDPDSELVTETDTGRSAIKLQALLESND
jgi:Mn-dependent DtxR family transcriptional regulator